jgi:pimeloyl-ACP methyl ester carboxylesterase
MSVSEPVIVLVHGAWADASSWSSVMSELQRRGFTVYAPPNTLRGMPEDSAKLHQFLTQNAALEGQPVVLVGHSYGGAVTTNAAVGASGVRALVYVDAFIPDEGAADQIIPPAELTFMAKRAGAHSSYI